MNQSLTSLNSTEAFAVGGILGGALGSVIAIALIYYILCVIANWKIFTKAGEAGWKSIIPFYNTYILCRIMGVNFWMCYLIPFAVVAVAGSAFGTESNGYLLLNGAFTIYFTILTAIKLGAAFNKSTGFKVGLALLPNIFLLILGFGDSKYSKPATKK